MITSLNSYTNTKNLYSNKRTTQRTVPNTQLSSSLTFGSKPSGNKSMFDPLYEKLANSKIVKKIILAIASSKPIKAIVDWAAKEKNSDNIVPYLMISYSAFLQANHIYNINKDKKIPQERKEPLLVNNTLAFILPTIGALTIDKKLNNSIKRFQDYAEKTRGRSFNEIEKKGIKTMKSVFVFGLMYKYFATVITTPMADVVTDWMRKNGMFKTNPQAAAQKK